MNHKATRLTLALFAVKVSLAVFLIMNDGLNGLGLLGTAIYHIGVQSEGEKAHLGGEFLGRL